MKHIFRLLDKRNLILKKKFKSWQLYLLVIFERNISAEKQTVNKSQYWAL